MSNYFDRTGRPIELLEWARLWEDADYRILHKTDVTPTLRIVTVWEGFWPYAVLEEGKRIFHTAAIHRLNRDTVTEVEILDWWDTEDEAHAGHARHVFERGAAFCKRCSMPLDPAWTACYGCGAEIDEAWHP